MQKFSVDDMSAVVESTQSVDVEMDVNPTEAAALARVGDENGSNLPSATQESNADVDMPEIDPAVASDEGEAQGADDNAAAAAAVVTIAATTAAAAAAQAVAQAAQTQPPPSAPPTPAIASDPSRPLAISTEKIPQRDTGSLKNVMWTMEKVFYLNHSRTKWLTVGVDLSQGLAEIYSFFHSNNNDLGVGLRFDEMKTLFTSEWQRMCLRHLSGPQLIGVSRHCGPAKFLLTTLRNLEPALKIESMCEATGRTNYVLLGEVTVRNMFRLAPAILFHMQKLDNLATCHLGDWIDETINDVVCVLENPRDLLDDDVAQYLISEEGFKICRGKKAVYWENRLEFVLDLCYRHHEWFAKLTVEAIHGNKSFRGVVVQPRVPCE